MVKIVTCNVQGLGNFQKRRQMFYFFHEKNFDIVFVQESHSTKKCQRQWRNEWGGPIYFSHGTSSARGVAILFSRKFLFQLLNTRHDDRGRFIETRIRHEESILTLVNVYAPNEDDYVFYTNVFEQIRQVEVSDMIFGGDLNLVLDLDKDKTGGRSTTHHRSQRVVMDFMDEFNLVDIWRIQHPNDRIYTWRGIRGQEEVRVRLDYLLISDTMSSRVVGTEIKASFKSDHSIPFLDIELNRIPRGKGVWKINVSLLHEKNFITQVNKAIDEEKLNEYDSARHRWEVIKLRIRNIAIELSVRKNRDRNLRLKALEKKLQNINNKGPRAFTVFWDQKEIQEHKTRLHREIEEIIEYKTRGASMRCKTNWAEHGGKPSRYFLNLEKVNYTRKTITRLKDDQGRVQTDLGQLQDLEANFFAKLYKKKEIAPEQLESFFEGIEGPKLSVQLRSDLELPITKGELSLALKEMKNFKTPGPDGLPAEIYKCFWEKLQDPLWEAMKESWKFGFESDMLRSLITLLGKKDRDPLLLGNWRPINLLNVDYKIISKTIANRIKKVLPLLIGPEQKGFIAGRYIGENIRELLSVVNLCKQDHIPSFLVSFDFQSAFDSVHLQYFDYVLGFFGFGPIFRQYMRTLYEGITASVLNNGYLSEAIQIQAGFRQGCVLSPGNFALALEPLILKIKQAGDVRGIPITQDQDVYSLFGLFADDIWSTIYGSEQNLNNLLYHFQRFTPISGLKLNYNKTQIMRIGSLKNSQAIFYTIKPLNWVEEVKILGINLNAEGETNTNFVGIIDKIKHVSSIWINRDLNIMNKIVICNSLMSSVPVYKLLITVSPPNDFFRLAKKIVLEFIWEGKPPKIRYSKLIKSKWVGGLSLSDLELKNRALKASWVYRILRNNSAPWAILAYRELPINSNIIWDCSIQKRHILKMFDTNKFWVQVWIAWTEIKGIDKPMSRDEVLSEVIWYNSAILRRGLPWRSQQMCGAGIYRIQDIYDDQRDIFLTFNQLCMKFGQKFDILEYNAILVAIPMDFKLKLQNQVNVPIVLSLTEKMMSKKKPSQFLNSLVRGQIEDADGCHDAWSFDLNIEIDENQWNNILTDVYLLTNLDYLRWFQYRLIHRVLTTNVRRNKYDPQIANKCEFCKVSPETILHLFLECPIVKKFWQTFKQWMSYILDILIVVEPFAILFNSHGGSDKMLINTMILIAKQYIYSCKCQGLIPKYAQFIQKVSQIMAIEKTIAIRQNKLQKHNRKWQAFQNI